MRHGQPALEAIKIIFFYLFEIRIFSRSKGQFFKIFKIVFNVVFQNRDRGLKFLQNNLQIEQVKTYLNFFQY